MLALIAAVAENGVIGRQGTLPWRLSADLRRFRRLTMGHHVIMGRRTFESLPGPLPGRKLVVLSRSQTSFPSEVVVAGDLQSALQLCEDDSCPFVIGGASVYQAALPIVQTLYLTIVHADVPGDTMFPSVNWSEWTLQEDCWHAADAKNQYCHSFRRYQRKQQASTGLRPS